MAWVRYDDQFPINTKVTAVVVEDPGALALHVLANTWSNTTRTPGYVPPHQPSVLLCDRVLAEKWADVLVRSGLWHIRGNECPDCVEDYVKAASGGWVFHHAKTYQAPARDRTTPGTSAELSEKRREAGRKGGRASASKRGVAGEASKQVASFAQANPEASQANPEAKPGERPSKTTDGGTGEPLPPAETELFAGVSKTDLCSRDSVTPDPDPVPEVLASNEASCPPDGQPTFAGMSAVEKRQPEHPKAQRKPRRVKRETTPEEDAENQLVNKLTKVYTDKVKLSDFMAVRGIVVAARSSGFAPDAISAGLAKLAENEDPISKEILRRAIKGDPSWAKRNLNSNSPFQNPKDQNVYDDEWEQLKR